MLRRCWHAHQCHAVRCRRLAKVKYCCFLRSIVFVRRCFALLSLSLPYRVSWARYLRQHLGFTDVTRLQQGDSIFSHYIGHASWHAHVHTCAHAHECTHVQMHISRRHTYACVRHHHYCRRGGIPQLACRPPGEASRDQVGGRLGEKISHYERCEALCEIQTIIKTLNHAIINIRDFLFGAVGVCNSQFVFDERELMPMPGSKPGHRERK
jgi:hypothetical protein